MENHMLWVKAFHVIFVVSWFAGLLYLPRLFVYHSMLGLGTAAQQADPPGHERFCVMERRLYAITNIGMMGAWTFGLWTLWLESGYLRAGWLHAKLTLVVLLTAYQIWLKLNLRRFAAGTNARGPKFWRWANEVPALFLIAIVILVIVKPF